LFEALIQIETNTQLLQLLLPYLQCGYCRLSPTHTYR